MIRIETLSKLEAYVSKGLGLMSKTKPDPVALAALEAQGFTVTLRGPLRTWMKRWLEFLMEAEGNLTAASREDGSNARSRRRSVLQFHRLGALVGTLVDFFVPESRPGKGALGTHGRYERAEDRFEMCCRSGRTKAEPASWTTEFGVDISELDPIAIALGWAPPPTVDQDHPNRYQRLIEALTHLDGEPSSVAMRALSQTFTATLVKYVVLRHVVVEALAKAEDAR